MRAGALASIYSSSTDIGRHLALVVKQLSGEERIDGPRFEFARFYSISSNRRVAQALAVTLPDEASLRSALDRARL